MARRGAPSRAETRKSLRSFRNAETASFGAIRAIAARVAYAV
jgi:hypothetical protein